jgi:hypothetical protein
VERKNSKILQIAWRGQGRSQGALPEQALQNFGKRFLPVLEKNSLMSRMALPKFIRKPK